MEREKIFECAAGYVAFAEPEDADAIFPRLRKSDLRECRASHGDVNVETIRENIRVTPGAFTLFLSDGTPIGLGGCAPLEDGRGGSPWLLGTRELLGVQFYFLKYCRFFIEAMLEEYGYLENYVHEANTVSRKWLAWCGFEFDEPAPWGPYGETFRRFYQCAIRSF